jgi:arginine deiminase
MPPTVRAEFDPLSSVRVHTPGLELWSGGVDPEPNLFDTLLGWCNVAAEGLAVADADLARHAAVDVYVRDGDGYEFDRPTDALDYLEGPGVGMDGS